MDKENSVSKQQQQQQEEEAIQKQNKKREERKQVWEEAGEAVQKVLLEWMKHHPGEDMDPQILAECGRDVYQRVATVILAAQQQEQKRDNKGKEEEEEEGKGKKHHSNRQTNHHNDDLFAIKTQGFVREVYRRLRVSTPSRKERSHEEWAAIFPRYPKSKEDDRFCFCFEPTDKVGMRAAFNKYGMFVVKVMSEEQVEKSVRAMFEEVNQQREAEGIVEGPTISPTDPSTWMDGNWPSKQKFLVQQPAFHPVAFENRRLESIFQVFSNLYNDENKLHATVDNWGICRGGAINPKWTKTGLKPHWDINPWWFQKQIKLGNQPGFQGLVALSDQTEETGCHLTLPGGVNFTEQWIRENPLPKAMNKKSKHADPNDPVIQFMQPIPLRKGEMIVWSWGQLHGSTDSHSTDMRLHQYIRLYPAPEAGFDYDYAGHDRYSSTRIIKRAIADGLVSEETLKEILPDTKSRRLFGLAPYEEG